MDPAADAEIVIEDGLVRAALFKGLVTETEGGEFVLVEKRAWNVLPNELFTIAVKPTLVLLVTIFVIPKSALVSELLPVLEKETLIVPTLVCVGSLRERSIVEPLCWARTLALLLTVMPPLV